VGRFTAAREPRIFYQDIQASPACCFDPSGERVPDTTVWMVPSADRFLLAVLNSPLYGWYARHRFPPALGGAVRPKRSYLAQLPLPAPAPAARASIEALVEQRLDPALPAAAARELDAALADAVLAAYAITGPERAVLAR
jgi:glycine cleavage system aminomethyltransferase T